MNNKNTPMANLPFMKRRSSSIKKEFTEKELEELKTAFDLLDRNQDGKVNPEELKIMLNNLGIDIKYEKAEEIIRGASHSGGDIIDQNDFLTFVKRIQQPSPGDVDEDLADDLTAAFKVFDLNGDGFISRDELKIAMDMIGEPITDEQLDHALEVADIDKDGRINYEEFVKVLTS